MEMAISSRKLALWYFDAGVFRDREHPQATQRGEERGFALPLHESIPDAPLFPVSWDLRTPGNPNKPGPLTYDLIQLTGFELWWLAHEMCPNSYKFVVGLPYAGDPFAEALIHAHRTVGQTVKLLHLRKKTEQTGRQYIGELRNPPTGLNDKVLVVDDVIGQAEAKLQGIEVLRKYGLEVSDVMVVLDREQGGVKLLQQAGVNVHALFTQTQLLHLYEQEGRIPASVREEVLEYEPMMFY